VDVDDEPVEGLQHPGHLLDHPARVVGSAQQGIRKVEVKFSGGRGFKK